MRGEISRIAISRLLRDTGEATPISAGKVADITVNAARRVLTFFVDNGYAAIVEKRDGRKRQFLYVSTDKSYTGADDYTKRILEMTSQKSLQFRHIAEKLGVTGRPLVTRLEWLVKVRALSRTGFGYQALMTEDELWTAVLESLKPQPIIRKKIIWHRI